jgi:hypothetical protein
MIYVCVENNQIVEGPKSLPKSWRNISGLHHLDSQGLKDLGWLPFNTVVTDGEVEVNTTVEIMEDEVVQTITKRPYTAEEMADIAAGMAAQRKRERAEAYREESDPIFFKSQRGEATTEEWVAKVNEIKMRLPD